MKETDNDLWLLLGEIKAGVSSMHARFDSLVADHNKLEETTDARLNSHSNRIARVERFQWMLLGAATLLSVGIPIAISLLA